MIWSNNPHWRFEVCVREHRSQLNSPLWSVPDITISKRLYRYVFLKKRDVFLKEIRYRSYLLDGGYLEDFFFKFRNKMNASSHHHYHQYSLHQTTTIDLSFKNYTQKSTFSFQLPPIKPVLIKNNRKSNLKRFQYNPTRYLTLLAKIIKIVTIRFVWESFLM